MKKQNQTYDSSEDVPSSIEELLVVLSDFEDCEVNVDISGCYASLETINSFDCWQEKNKIILYDNTNKQYRAIDVDEWYFDYITEIVTIEMCGLTIDLYRYV